jgi:hypothetical protein
MFSKKESKMSKFVQDLLQEFTVLKEMGKLAAIIAFLTLFVAVNANVIGFDFGSTFFKITLVKPGSPFSIVENLTSKRKTETMMTIGNE